MICHLADRNFSERHRPSFSCVSCECFWATAPLFQAIDRRVESLSFALSCNTNRSLSQLSRGTLVPYWSLQLAGYFGYCGEGLSQVKHSVFV